METARNRLLQKFMTAQTEEEQFAVCAEHISLNLEEVDRTDDVDGFNQRMRTLDQVICEDAKRPEILERFLAKISEPLSPEMRKRFFKILAKKK